VEENMQATFMHLNQAELDQNEPKWKSEKHACLSAVSLLSDDCHWQKIARVTIQWLRLLASFEELPVPGIGIVD
jgi:hypothetical protein